LKNFYWSEEMINQEYRLREFLPDTGHPALILDASAGLSLGTLPGLEDFSTALRPQLPHLDGLVCSPGQLRRLGSRTRADSALLVRMDWTNTLRGSTFFLPPKTAAQVLILQANDALELGAVGMVFSFLLGYDETIEAACLKAAVQLSLAGKELGLPLLVEVCPSGPRVALPDKAVELGASFALESGADAIVVPYPGLSSLKTIATMLTVPWFIKPTSDKNQATEWAAALKLGASGLWLDHNWLTPAVLLTELADRVHHSPQRSD
jgi:DhnA family fructose-bisphosphate aldolase class Ia